MPLPWRLIDTSHPFTTVGGTAGFPTADGLCVVETAMRSPLHETRIRALHDKAPPEGSPT